MFHSLFFLLSFINICKLLHSHTIVNQNKYLCSQLSILYIYIRLDNSLVNLSFAIVCCASHRMTLWELENFFGKIQPIRNCKICRADCNVELFKQKKSFKLKQKEITNNTTTKTLSTILKKKNSISTFWVIYSRALQFKSLDQPTNHSDVYCKREFVLYLGISVIFLTLLHMHTTRTLSLTNFK